MARTVPARRHHATALKREGSGRRLLTYASMRPECAQSSRRRKGSLGSAGLIRTRTSTHQTPSCRATTGLRSSSLTSGRSSASLETRSSASASAAVSTGGVPRSPASSGAALTAWIISSASASVSGVSRAT